VSKNKDRKKKKRGKTEHLLSNVGWPKMKKTNRNDKQLFIHNDKENVDETL